MKKFYLIMCLFSGFSCSISGQSTKGLIQTKIDSVWRTLQIHGNIPLAMELSRELLTLGDTQGSHEASVNAYQVLGEAYLYKNELDSSLQSYTKGLELAENAKDSVQNAYILQSIAIVKEYKGLYRESLDLHKQSLSLWESLRDTSEMIFSLFKISNALVVADRHEETLNTQLKIMNLSRKTGDSLSMAYAYLGMGIVHKKQGNYDLAIKTNLDAIKIFNELEDRIGAASARVNLALVYKSEGELTKAYTEFKSLFVLFEKENHLQGMTACMSNMAICSNRLGMYDRALLEAGKALDLGISSGNKESEADMSNEMGIAYLGLGRFEDALEWSLRSLALTEEIHSVEKGRDAAKTLSDIYNAMGNYELALSNFKLFKQLNDSIFEKEKSNQILELQTRFETEEKQMEIEKLEASEAHLRVLKNVFIGGSILIFLLSCVIINREIKRRRKAGRLLEAEKKLAILNKQRLEDQIHFKNRELTSHALHLAQKHELIQNLKKEMNGIEKNQTVNNIVRKISFDKNLDDQWEQFIQIFTETNPSFFENLMSNFSNLSKTDIRLCALIKMNLGNKDICSILNISDEGVKKARYRLRKKMQLENSVNLEVELMSIS